MRYQEVSEKMPNATIFYENITSEELDTIVISKYQLDSEQPGLFYVGTNSELEHLSNKKMYPSTGMSFN